MLAHRQYPFRWFWGWENGERVKVYWCTACTSEFHSHHGRRIL
jgi:hypothetical protein